MVTRKGDKKGDTTGEPMVEFPDDSENQTIDRNQIMGMQARNRMNNWAANTVDDMQLLTKLRKGLVTHHSVHKHEFRDRNKSMEKANVPFIPRK